MQNTSTPPPDPPVSGRSGLGSQRYLRLFEHLMPLVGSHDRGEIARQSCHLIAEMLDVEACSLMMVDRWQRHLELLAATHIPAEQWGSVRLPVDQGIGGKVFQEGKPLLITSNAQFRKLFGRSPEQRYQSASCVVVPLVVRGWLSGVVNVAHPRGRRAFRQRDVDLLQSAASLIAAALGHAIQNIEMMQLQRTLEDIFESLHVGILSVSRQQTVIHANRRARRLLGMSEHLQSDFEIGAVLPGTVYNVCLRLMGQSSGQEEPAQDRVRAIIGGQSILLEITVGRLRALGEGYEDHIIMIEDVTQEEEVTRLREAEAMKHCFLAVISHELRTPLAVIRGAVPMLDPARPPSAQMLAQLHELLMKNCQRLGGVVDSILDVTEIESGTFMLTRQPIDLHALLAEIVEQNRKASSAKNLQVEIDYGELDQGLMADRRRLRQVLGELFANAVKFSFNDQTIRIQVRSKAPWVEIRISDVGLKIGPSERGAIFQKFFQADSTSTRTAGGCGLGLYLAQNILRLHGGMIELLPSADEETIFVVRLPMNGSGQEEAAPAATAPSSCMAKP